MAVAVAAAVAAVVTLAVAAGPVTLPQRPCTRVAVTAALGAAAAFGVWSATTLMAGAVVAAVVAVAVVAAVVAVDSQNLHFITSPVSSNSHVLHHSEGIDKSEKFLIEEGKQNEIIKINNFSFCTRSNII
jgi:hypothetical protein